MKNGNKKPFLIKDVSVDVTDRSAIPFKSNDNNTFVGVKDIEMKNLINPKQDAKENILDINRKTDRDFLILSMKCALPKEKRLNFEYQLETRVNKGIPRRFFDLLTISQESKLKYLKLRKSLINIDIYLSIFAIITITLAALDNSTLVTCYNVLTNNFNVPQVNNILRIVMAALNFFSIILIIRRYYCILDIHITRIGTVARKDTLLSRGLIWGLLIEILVHLVTIPPYIEHQFNINGSIYVEYDYTLLFNVDGLYLKPGHPATPSISAVMKSPSVIIHLYYLTSAMISFFILFRVYHVFRLNYTLSYFATPKADSICKIMNTQANFSFNLRSTLKYRPLMTLSFAIIFIILASGISMQLFEYYNSQMIYALDQTNNQHSRVMQTFSNIYNSFWLIIVTMTTVGYGDMYPTTYFGRIIAIIACIFGTFILSSLIVFLSNIISFDDLERQVFNEVTRDKNNSKLLKKEACSLVGKLIRYNYLRKIQKEKSVKYRLNIWIDMQYQTKTFKMIRVSNKKNQASLTSLIENIDDQLKIAVDPLRENLQIYNKNRTLNDKSANILNDTNDLGHKFTRNTTQMWNLLKLLNKDRCLPSLNDIDEVYDQTANVIEEIIYYHNYKEALRVGKIAEEKQKDYFSSSSGSSNNSNF